MTQPASCGNYTALYMTMKRLLLVGITLLTLNASLSSLAQTARNQPDPQGNFYSNDAPVKGTARSPLMAGSLWRVVALTLNCRRDPGSNQPVVRQFRRGDILQVEVYRGGSDEVLKNAFDRSRQPWMPVRGQLPDDRCYVRANQRYILPLLAPVKR